MAIKSLSKSELEVMKVIWDFGRAVQYADVAGKLEEKNYSWKKNTVLTFLTRLVEKNLLSVKKVGRKNQYYALVSENEYLERQTETFVEDIYEGDVKGLITNLVQNDLISPDELEDLQQFWKRMKSPNE
ncbi:BlaI/MecI/CopY family transcriptional regulator [Listeria monocytogenes]|uniref:BlaI/MecI/CopY family transcriptional regulator n=1 Tax=Listeria monocytogenes TaxID=1639 RepID=UPI00085C6151|nr:BlaI/MecI/CopY family transcriptional regulator [Listeria monocytogenes]EAD7632056.1 BlaI/MecI/CopY family transcriptional regulator [Listeria monocytogenes]EAG9489328.1 BlaI/MecI/CopY family transcriptional regulator [Listeria monocytogenes]EFQ9070731.1 BlaI/MecI/CopY family transcriptional regulator [Listeria monocytogenes]EGU0986813.1 BlaI/MecI/CopY family transcriptional regulator [Listeria monocytogenes]EHR3638696.1 BlaI/MecI/CopY family transcriptional regulator [Listeria monocytogene